MNTDNSDFILQQILTRMLARQDPLSGADITIDTVHAKIHNGDAFMWSYNVTLAGGLDSFVRIETPNTPDIFHIEWSIVATAGVTAIFREDYTGAHVSGNVLTPVNRNRNSTKTSMLTVCHTPNGGADGDILWQDFAGVAGVPVSAKPGNTSSRAEFPLRQGGVYLMSVAGTNDDIVTYNFDGYFSS